MKSKNLTRLLTVVLSVILMMGTLCLPASAAKSISKATVTVASAIYTGKTLKPKVTVKLSGKTLSSKYYTVSYTNSKNIGKATVTVKGKNGYSGTVKKNFSVVPAKVTGVKVTADADSATVSWKKVTGATHYRIDLYTGGKWVKKATTSKLSAEISGLSGYTSYSFRVRAYKKVSGTYYSGAYSSTVKATTLLPAPKDVKATTTENSVKLQWSKVTKANYYQIWLYEGSKVLSTETTGKTSFTFKNLDCGTKYTLKVRAYVKKGDTRTYGAYANKVYATTSLSAPTSLKVSDLDLNQAKISWSEVSGADYYIVEIENEAGDLKSTTSNTNSCVIEGLRDTTWVTVYVRAFNETTKNTSKAAQIEFPTKPAAPESVKVSEITSSGAKVQYSISSMHTGFVVYLNKLDSTGATVKRTEIGKGTSSTVVNNLESATKYRFEVRAYNTRGDKTELSEPKYSEIFTTLPGKVENLQALSSGNTVALTWTLNAGADGYEVYDSSKNLLKELDSSKSIYTHYGLQEGKGYTFYVRLFIKDTNGNKIYGDYTEISTLAGGAKVTGVSFTKKTTQMTAGETFQTSIKVEPADAKNTAVTYKSSDTSVAQVDITGKITAIKNGTAKITVTTDDGGFTDSFTLKVEEIKLQSVSVDSSYTAYIGDMLMINPTFVPENVSDKSFTLTGTDYSYSYKLGIFSKTDTCKFSDYFYVDNLTGTIFALKATVEPKSEENKAFAFTVKLTASNGKSTTFKLSATKRLININRPSDNYSWSYGNTVKLTADVDSSADFKADSLRWTSSNPNIATVSQDGTVKCVGTGKVTITATAPNNKDNHAISFYVTPLISLEKDYFENCTAGETYQLKLNIKPASADLLYSFSSSDSNIAVVSSDGKVTFKKTGTVTISVSSNSTKPIKAVLTTGRFTPPSENTTSLLSTMENSANRVKTVMPALTLTSVPTFTNVYIQKESSTFKTSDLIDVFKDFASPQSKFIRAVTETNYSSPEAYNNAYLSYLASVPVSGQPLTIIPGLGNSDIKSIRYIDNGSYTYDIVLTLNDEYMESPPVKPENTAHGKVFDILENKYMELIKKGFSDSSSGMSLSYTAFRQNYNNSSLTLTLDKATGNVTHMKYDMNVHVEIIDLKLTMTLITAIDSTVTFDVNNLVEYDVTF